jgi:hypothetical protein
MKGMFDSDPKRFIRHCKGLTRKDWDDVHLFTGVEGAGKTTWAFQIMRALDPDFGLHAVHFPHDAFLDYCTHAPRDSAALWDEGRLNKRRAMHGSTLDVLDFLQDCRALNLHLGICFPHEALLDNAVKDHRVRWRHHIIRRGLSKLMIRQERHGRGGKSYWIWVETGDVFAFKENKGALWQAYRIAKEDHMRRRNQDEDASDHGLDRGQLRLVANEIAASIQ